MRYSVQDSVADGTRTEARSFQVRAGIEDRLVSEKAATGASSCDPPSRSALRRDKQLDVLGFPKQGQMPAPHSLRRRLVCNRPLRRRRSEVADSAAARSASGSASRARSHAQVVPAWKLWTSSQCSVPSRQRGRDPSTFRRYLTLPWERAPVRAIPEFRVHGSHRRYRPPVRICTRTAQLIRRRRRSGALRNRTAREFSTPSFPVCILQCRPRRFRQRRPSRGGTCSHRRKLLPEMGPGRANLRRHLLAEGERRMDLQ